MLAPSATRAKNASWLSSPATGNFTTGANWASLAGLQRGAAANELAALGALGTDRRVDGSRLAREARGAASPGLEPRICRHGTAGNHHLRRRASFSVHYLWRDAATRRCGAGSFSHRDRRSDVGLSPLGGLHLRAGQRTCPHRWRAHDLVILSQFGDVIEERPPPLDAHQGGSRGSKALSKFASVSKLLLSQLCRLMQ